jgi:hypothetical protein
VERGDIDADTLRNIAGAKALKTLFDDERPRRMCDGEATFVAAFASRRGGWIGLHEWAFD